MDPFRDTSSRAAFRADFSEHLPLSDGDLQRLRDAPDRRRSASVLAGFRMLFGRFRDHREWPDALGLTAFTPPL